MYYPCSENKGAVMLICAFGFACANRWFSDALAYFNSLLYVFAALLGSVDN